MHLHRGIVQKREVPVRAKIMRKYTVSYLRFKELFPDGSINANVNLASEECGKRIFQACVEVYRKEMLDWD